MYVGYENVLFECRGHAGIDRICRKIMTSPSPFKNE
jgi:hypothetical protein